MKIKLITALAMVMALVLASCSAEEITDPTATNVNQHEEYDITVLDEAGVEQSVSAEDGASGSDVNFDFTQMSSTLVYAQVYDFITNANDYVDKSFRVQGQFQSATLDDGSEICFIVVNDATGCCPQGIEVRLSEGAEKPENGSIVLVDTVAGSYEYGDMYYGYMQIESMELL